MKQQQQIVIAGSGFAGLWAALAAARAVALAGQQDRIAVSVVSPAANLAVRPRLYEASLDNMNPDIAPLLAAVGVNHIAGLVERIDAETRQLTIARADGSRATLAYDRFVLAAGSRLFRPDVPGLAEHGFDADQLDSALALDAHIKDLAARQTSPARNTVVVAGGGLTGLETATEMPGRLRAALGLDAEVRVVLVDSAAQVGAALGEQALPFIQEALAEAGVETRPGARVTALDANGVTLSTGECIDSHTVVWTAGMRAHPLAAQVPGEHDGLGRVIGDAYLRAPAASGVFATGDTVHAATDDAGNVSVMSCQHALSLGRVAGYNAAAELLGLPLHAYRQPKYVTCIDLGPWGALYTEGWDRQVHLTRAEGKRLKQEINTVWIYPPAPDRDAVFAMANPDYVIVP